MLVSNHPLHLLRGGRAVWLWSALLPLCYQNCIHAGAHAEPSGVGVFGLYFRSCASLTQTEIYLLLLCKLNSFPPKVECGNSSFFSIIFPGHLKLLTTLKKCPPEYPSPTCILKYVTM